MPQVKDGIIDANSHRLNEDESPLLTGADKENALHEDEKQPKDPKKMVEILQEMETKYAAYVRKDTYGTMGKGDLSVREKAVLVVALLVFVPVKIILIFAILVAYYIICRVCTMFKSPQDMGIDEKDNILTRNVSNEENDSSGNQSFLHMNQGNYANLIGLRKSIIVHSGRFFSRCLLFIVGFYWIKSTRRDLQSNRKASEVIIDHF